MMAKNLLTVSLVLFAVVGQLSSELNKLSYSENEERANKCGTEFIFDGKPLNNPWMIKIKKNPGLWDFSLGLLISPRHAIFTSFLIFDKDWPFTQVKMDRFEAGKCENKTPTAVIGSTVKQLDREEFRFPITSIYFFGNCSIKWGFLIYEFQNLQEPPPPICLEGIDDDSLDVLFDSENITIEADVFLNSDSGPKNMTEQIPGTVYKCNDTFSDVCWSPIDEKGKDVLLKYQDKVKFKFQSSWPLIKPGKRPSLIGFISGFDKNYDYTAVYTFKMYEMNLCSIIGTCKSVPTTPTTTTTTTRIITTTPIPPSTSPPPTTTLYEVALQEEEGFEIPYDRKIIKKGSEKQNPRYSFLFILMFFVLST